MHVATAIRKMRPATRFAMLVATFFVACCFSRSEARNEVDPAHAVDTSRVVGTWYAQHRFASAHGGAFVRDVRYVYDDARARDVVASAEGMYATPKLDDAVGLPTKVAPLQVETDVHSQRVVATIEPEVQLSAHLAPGARKTVRMGTPEVAWVTERVTYWDDVVVDRAVISKEVVHAGTRALVLEGTPRTLAQLRAVRGYHIASMMTMVATAYTADSATSEPTGYTATGMLARQGVVAVDPAVIPLGTMLFVPGYGIAVAADTGGAIIGDRIDLCMDSYPDAVDFGRQTVHVYVLKR